MPSDTNLEVVPEKLFVVGVSTFLDDELSALHGAFSSEVGHALLGDDDVDIML